MSYNPTAQQRLAKQKFHTQASKGLITIKDVSMLSLSQIVSFTGNKNIISWAEKDSSFLPWFLDVHDFADKVAASAEATLGVLEDIIYGELQPKLLSAKDKIAAIALLMQLADKHPNKRREYVFLDKEVAKLNESQVESQLKLYASRLEKNDEPEEETSPSDSGPD